MKNNKQTSTAIVALICSAVALLAAVLFVQPAPSHADLVIKDRDYQMVTAKTNTGSDALYIIEGRSGTMAVFVYEAGKGLVFKGREPISNAMGGR